MIKVAILDFIPYKAIQALKTFAHVENKITASHVDLMSTIHKYDCLIVKSGNVLNKTLLAKADRLKVIGRAGTGMDNIDIETARARNIQIITSPDGHVSAVAEYILGSVFLLTRRLWEANKGALHNDFRRINWQGRDLENLSIGLIGFGRIGRCLAKKLSFLCKKIYVYDPWVEKSSITEFKYVNFVSDFYSMLSKVDLVSMQLPLNQDTENLLDKRAFMSMKKGMLLINASRGGVINQFDLLEAMNDKIVIAAVLDTISPDPKYNVKPELSTFSHYLIHHPRVFYTPHIAAETREAVNKVAIELVNKIKEFFINENIV